MHSTTALAKGLQSLRKKVETTHRELRTRRVEENKQKSDDTSIQQLETFKQFVPAPDLAAFFATLSQMVTTDVNRYSLPAAAPQTLSQTPPNTPPTPQVAPLNTVFTPSVFTQPLANALPLLWEKTLTGNTPHERYGQIFDIEINDLTGDSPLVSSVGANAIPKLKNAKTAYEAARYGDALTILKVTLRNDPHNQTLAFLVSQFLYLLAGQGQQNAHPEARDLAQKAMIASDKFPPEKILWYRYCSISSELNHSPERALEWLRETELTSPTHLSQKEGWFAGGGFYLKSLLLLSRISPEVWGEREFSLLTELVNKSLGGGSIYLHVFRQSLHAQENRKDINEKIKVLETALAIAYTYYLTISNGFTHISHATTTHYWTVRNRFLVTLSQTATAPQFDHILTNISLNAQAWQVETYPDPEIRVTLDDSTAAYWRWWAMAVSPTRDNLHPHPLSTDDALAEIDFLEEAGALLQLLAAEENNRKRPDVWEKIQPWIIRWELDHLLAAGTGSNQPRDKFLPSFQPLNLYYRRWSEPVPSSPLASEMIAKNAQKGGFGSWYEVLAAFEGAIRLIDDPNHGIVAMQKRALAFAKVQDPNRFAGLKVAGGPADLSKFGALILPLGLIAGILLSMQIARNAGQAIGIILVMLGIAGLAFMSIARKNR